jgi:hypothetical protein
MAELAQDGLLDPEDAALFASGSLLSTERLSQSFERLISRLEGAGGKAGTGGPLTLSEDLMSASDRLTSRQALLIADLLTEFGSSLVARSAGLTLGPLTLSGTDPAVLSAGRPHVADYASLGSLRLQEVPRTGKRTLLTLPGNEGVRALEGLLGRTVSTSDAGGTSAAQVEMGVMSPLGPLAVELTSLAAARPKEDLKVEEGRPDAGFDLATSVRLSEILKVSAEFFKGDQTSPASISTSFGVQIGDKEGPGVTVGRKVTDLTTPESGSSQRETITSLDLKYALPDVVSAPFASDFITVSAGYELYGREGSPTTSRSYQATTVLGIDYKLLLGDSAFLQAGYRYEKIRDLIASGAVWTKAGLYDDKGFLAWSARDLLKLESSDATRMVASIDLGYRLLGDSSVTVGYKLIDFADVGVLDLTRNMATAEVTIKF